MMRLRSPVGLVPMVAASAVAVLVALFMLLARSSPPQPEQPAGGTRACRATDLNVVWYGSNGLTGGQALGYIAAGNRSTTGCILQGMPSIAFFRPDGTELGIGGVACTPAPTKLDLFQCDPTAPVTLAPALATIAPHQAVQGQAIMTLMWGIHDGAGFCKSPPQPLAPVAEIQLTIGPTGDTVHVAVPQYEADLLGRAPCSGAGVEYFPFRAVQPRT